MELAKAYVQIIPTAKGIKAGLEDVMGNESKGAGTSAGKNIAGSMVGTIKEVVAAAGIAEVIKSAFDVGMQFDTSMSQVAATMGITKAEIEAGSEEFEKLSNAAKEMGRTTQFSASESSDALNYLALAGYDTETSISTLPMVLNLAAAGDMQLASASDMVTDSLSALGKGSDYAETLVDQMAKTASKSNTSVAQLGDAILTVGGTAQKLSGGTTELNTVLGVLADNGIKAAEGGTHLRNIILGMNPVTDKAAAMWEALGVSGYDAQGNLKPLSETFGALKTAMAGMSDEERSSAIAKLFNTTDIAAVNALLNTSSERWIELSSAVEDSSGAAANMAETMNANLEGALKSLNSAWEGIQIELIAGASGLATEMVLIGADAINALTDAYLTDGVVGMAQAIGKMVAGLMQSFASFIASYATPEILNAGVAMIKNFADGVFLATPNVILNAGTLLQTLLTTFINFAPRLAASGFALISYIGTGIVNNAPAALSAVSSVLARMLGTLASNAPQMIQSGIMLMGRLAAGVISAIPQIASVAGSAVKSAVGEFRKFDWKSIGANIVKGIVNGIKGAVGLIASAAKQAARNALDSAKSALGIHSPSKVFEEQVGAMISAGMAEGIKATAYMPTAAVNTVTRTMKSSAVDAIDVKTFDSSIYAPVKNATSGGIDELIELTRQLVDKRQDIYLSNGTLVGALAGDIDKALGKRQRLATRGG